MTGLAAIAGVLASVLALGAAAPAAVDGGHRHRMIEVIVRHTRFSPEHMRVAPGATVRFVVRNADPIAHEFLLGDEDVQRRHETGTEAHHGARPGEISLPPNSTVETTYSFDERGAVLLGCHLPGHWDYGMRGAVVVL